MLLQIELISSKIDITTSQAIELLNCSVAVSKKSLSLDVVQVDDNSSLDIELGRVLNIGCNYEQMKNKPSIEGVVLQGNKLADELKLQKSGNYVSESITNEEIYNILKN